MKKVYVRKCVNTPKFTKVLLDDSFNPVYIGAYRPMEDYIDECLHGNNECTILIEKCVNIKSGVDIIVWGDYETNETFITF